MENLNTMLKAYCQGRLKVQMLFVEPVGRDSTTLAKAELTTSNTNNIRVDPDCEPPETSIN